MTTTIAQQIAQEKVHIQSLTVTDENTANAMTTKIYSLYDEQNQHRQQRILTVLGFQGQINTLDPADIFLRVKESLTGCSDTDLKNLYILPPEYIHIIYDRSANQHISIADSLHSLQKQWESIPFFEDNPSSSSSLAL